jgi:MacB-like periplasmic core domain/FtsX-like permease family
MSVIGFVDSVARDLRFALRGLSRRPAFTFTAVLTLALGIGATTAIFSVVYSVLIKPLPYPNAEELVRIRHPAPGIPLADLQSSSNMYLTYRQENRAFASIGLWQTGSVTLTDGGETERVRSLRVTDGTLQALAVQPMLGRWFDEQDHAPAADGPAAVILSHAFWQRRFGGDDAVLGRALSVEAPDRNGTFPLTGPSQVVGTGFTDAVPLEWSGMGTGIAFEGQTPAAGRAPRTRIKFVSPGYFETMGTRLIAGRSVTWSDLEGGGRVAVVSEEFARWLAPEPAGALGVRVRFAGATGDAWREVVGVTQSMHEEGLYAEPVSMVYWPALAEEMFGLPAIGTPSPTFVVRSERAGTASLVEQIRQAVRAASPSIPVAQERTMQDLYAGSLARTSFTLVMLAIAGGMALALGVVGIYGVIAYVVTQRAREIGIRMALGAGRREVRMMFLRQGLVLSAVGLGVGLVAALAVTRLMSSLLFGTEPTDVVTYVAAIGVILAAAALASYLPARRASAIDPIETLKAE